MVDAELTFRGGHGTIKFYYPDGAPFVTAKKGKNFIFHGYCVNLDCHSTCKTHCQVDMSHERFGHYSNRVLPKMIGENEVTDIGNTELKEVIDCESCGLAKSKGKLDKVRPLAPMDKVRSTGV